ncbi:hypothetical protein FNF28_03536 [Cafeteria roenbergensis]|uniref:Uncharacterized protein n=1 Tax=Cafeteria roenbergensis TaxID=33653 RepID=A0A5A8DIN9_CAFRO|nr:hypothetical protein FNF28_03536 [Cafeteria roenbergensis]
MAAPALDVRAVDAALWEAAKEGNAAEARRLLDEGARVEWKKASKGGATALSQAAAEGNNDMVELLVDRGADLEAKGPYGATALVRAAARGHKDTVELLLDRGADVKAKNRDGSTALMMMASWGHKDTVELLLDRGADVKAKNRVRASTEVCCTTEGVMRRGRAVDRAGVEASRRRGVVVASHAGVGGLCRRGPSGRQ